MIEERDEPASEAFEALPRAIPALEPFDAHNRELARHAHPADWVDPVPHPRGYHLVVIGAGTAGLVSAAGAAGLGARVALIERALLGGDCLNVGCVPSKALIRSARALADARGLTGFGLRGGAVDARADFAAVMERMRRLRARIAPHDSAQRFRELGVDVFLGSARFVDGRTVEVGGARLRFARAVIATGARAVQPAIPGLAEAGARTNETIFSLTELPERLAVVGGGPIGCEFAQCFARFGSRVQLIEAGPRVLAREHEDAAAIVQAALVRDGVEILSGARLASVRTDGGTKLLALRRGREELELELEVDEILVGAGRAPNVEGLDLERAGVRYDARSGVAVNDLLRTSNPRIYAAGDICSPHKFTHVADASARIVVQNALFRLGPIGRARYSALSIPWCTYTDPELAHAGATEAELRERGVAYVRMHLPLADVDRALLDGEEEGLLLVLAARGSDRVLGASLVARHAGEMISELGLAITNGLGLKALARTIHPYPTQAEVFRRAGDAYNRTRLSAAARGLLAALLALRRP